MNERQINSKKTKPAALNIFN